jgi:hypothetical protein
VPLLDEAEIADPAFELPRIRREGRLLPSRERLVLDCVMELLIERGICLHLPGMLVFPSLFPAGACEPLEGAHGVSLYYDFTGPIDSLYAALVARAAAAERFGRVRLAPGRAELGSTDGGLCGLRLKSKLDLLVISGDLTQRADPRDFERVHRFLDLLLDNFSLSPQRCLIVPGSHDLSWDEEVYDWLPARKVDEDALPAGRSRRTAH